MRGETVQVKDCFYFEVAEQTLLGVQYIKLLQEVTIHVFFFKISYDRVDNICMLRTLVLDFDPLIN